MRPARRLVAATLGALTVVGASLPTAAVAAVDVIPVTFGLLDLVPGEHRSRDLTLDVREDATVTAVDLRSDGAPTFAWDARLCDAHSACRPVDGALVGLEMAPGTWTLTVTAAASDDLAPGDRSDIVGRLVLQGGDVSTAVGTGRPGPQDAAREASDTLPAGRTGPLALTGAAAPAWLALALAATATGAWLVVLARRRRDDATPEGAVP
ncbi:hypothetical protein [Cellulomonas dongxiuzhuiae]|uniref:LPXTG-motif cell wall anchor domain-containing protein n=1 Tax=Cellulomonas dongxiuzhuiae TaxID=2819979 RepID=A0ABX8GL02_9CELL|nr:hypothetical protein [Cellulomonas dongxiuzhuiae]MBO3096291.1 hypothetical protein [Cellulomonas dongxiuzhuiae]QWC16710.1 hypothetical protein KKR89_03415 [Cellulomonas dongxiuzhuiae]